MSRRLKLTERGVEALEEGMRVGYIEPVDGNLVTRLRSAGTGNGLGGLGGFGRFGCFGGMEGAPKDVSRRPLSRQRQRVSQPDLQRGRAVAKSLRGVEAVQIAPSSISSYSVVP